MADKKQQLLPPPGSRLPATVQPIKPSLPSLPSNSGKWLGSASTILEADRRYVETHGAYLRARADQATAMTELVSAREDLALAISRLHALPERCGHEYQKGRLTRLSELRLLDLRCQTDEVNAKSALAAAQLQLAQYQPAAAATPSSAPGLTPAEVNELIAALDDISPETKKTISYILMARMQEKQ